MNRFSIHPSDRAMWNRTDLERFLVDHQNQSIILDVNSEGCDLAAIGLYDLLDKFQFTDVTIDVVNRLETHPVYNIRYNDHIMRFFDVGDVDYRDLHSWSGEKVFGALYNRPIWHRIGLVGHLNHTYPEKSLINLRASCATEDDRQFFEMNELFCRDPVGAQHLLSMIDKLPMQLEHTDTWVTGVHTKQFCDQMGVFYPRFLVDIVAETFTTGKTFFPTEKTVRPMLMKKPFIVMGSENFLIYLRQMGFRTFSEFWSEDYDGYNMTTRYQLILSLIDSLAKKTEQELRAMYGSMTEVLDHNYNLLLSKQFTTNVTYVPNI